MFGRGRRRANPVPAGTTGFRLADSGDATGVVEAVPTQQGEHERWANEHGVGGNWAGEAVLDGARSGAPGTAENATPSTASGESRSAVSRETMPAGSIGAGADEPVGEPDVESVVDGMTIGWA